MTDLHPPPEDGDTNAGENALRRWETLGAEVLERAPEPTDSTTEAATEVPPPDPPKRRRRRPAAP